MASRSELQVLSPHEDAMAIPIISRQTVEEKKEQIEYYFRITVLWEERSRVGSSVAMLSLKGECQWD